ncbi:(Fe-S)-binding protein [Methanospirillum lacunae]|uniref:Fe-S cluster protein n=1 Tax=Methanospirillum lacunae TaxID=668570 RepID=A0A2V2N9Q6_9EURY|nr:(Fe-S)-binding protein [Methanospirillum lacunae]PWR74376.1 Fe-S cluster protein [Methanospirillum lacunae]
MTGSIDQDLQNVPLTPNWAPPGRNCGACGHDSCITFMNEVSEGNGRLTDCPFYEPQSDIRSHDQHTGNIPPARNLDQIPEQDILGNTLDFILIPLPGELSARKFLLPFRPDMVERWDIKPGDIITGRPMGAGCPVQHVVQVISVSRVSGLITGHVVGPSFSRGREVKDLEAYHMIGFEGIAVPSLNEPVFGKRMRFLPGFCMMNIGHTGVVNMVMGTKSGLHVRVEDIRIQ